MVKNKSKFFLFLGTILIGFFIVINIDINNTNSFLKMNSKEYKNAIEERNKLYDEITALSEDNYDLLKKIYQLNVDDNKDNQKVIKHMQEQLEEYNLLSGVVEAKGPGVVLTISDGSYDIYSDSQEEVNRKTLHSADAALILNELRTAGAEAIAINNYRVLNNTGVVCAWAFIRFEENKNEMEGAPFHFYAIGNPEQIEAALFAEGSHLNELVLRKLNVTLNKYDEMELPSASISISPKFMKRADN